jgi:SynChlorMet cassette protein ScmC
MEIKTYESNGYPKLLFVRGQSGKIGEQILLFNFEQNFVKSFPRSGCKIHDFRLLRLWSHDDVPDVICEIRGEDNHEQDIIRMWCSLHPIYQSCQESGGLPLHAALIERDGEGILLAGHGGAGKSTCCQRLPSPWHALCDDESLIVRDGQERYFAHPFPTWSDYLWKRSERTWNVQQFLPLAAIFFLEQADTDEAIPIGQGQAATFINQLAMDICQRNWRHLDRKEETVQRKQFFENACQLAKAAPAFILRITLTGRFWEEIEKIHLCRSG